MLFQWNSQGCQIYFISVCLVSVILLSKTQYISHWLLGSSICILIYLFYSPPSSCLSLSLPLCVHISYTLLNCWANIVVGCKYKLPCALLQSVILQQLSSTVMPLFEVLDYLFHFLKCKAYFTTIIFFSAHFNK